MHPKLRFVFMALEVATNLSDLAPNLKHLLNWNKHTKEVESFLIPNRNFSCTSSWRDGMGQNKQWAQQQVMINTFMKLRQSAFMRPMLKADDLYIQLKESGKQKMQSIVGPQIKLSNCLTHLSEKWVDCVSIGHTSCVLSPTTRVLLKIKVRPFRVTFLVIQHYELRLWTLESNSGADPGSVIYWLYSMGKLLNLLEPLFPHL